MTYPGVTPESDPDLAAVEDRRKEREEEYGTYVAAQAITWGNVLAFNEGDAVPKSTVERLGWVDLGLVRSASEDAEPAADQDGPVPTDADANAVPTPTVQGEKPATKASTKAAPKGDV